MGNKHTKSAIPAKDGGCATIPEKVTLPPGVRRVVVYVSDKEHARLATLGGGDAESAVALLIEVTVGGNRPVRKFGQFLRSWVFDGGPKASSSTKRKHESKAR